MAAEERKLRRLAADWEELHAHAIRRGTPDSSTRPCDVVEAGCLKPCRAVGWLRTGNTVYLAGGFDVTGVEYSQLAIDQARGKANMPACGSHGRSATWRPRNAAEPAMNCSSTAAVTIACARGLLSAYQAAVGRYLERLACDLAAIATCSRRRGREGFDRGAAATSAAASRPRGLPLEDFGSPALGVKLLMTRR
jgi:hypothetical protein